MVYEGEPEKAQAILDQLVQLRHRLTPPVVASDLYALGCRAGNDPTSMSNSRMEIDNIRADASLAISKVGLIIEFEPRSSEIHRHWDDAMDKLRRWIAAVGK